MDNKLQRSLAVIAATALFVAGCSSTGQAMHLDLADTVLHIQESR